MGMEQAILEHASALKELAAAIRSMGTTVSVGALRGETIEQSIARTESDIKTTGEKVSEAREAIQAALDNAKSGTKKNAEKAEAQAGGAAADKTVDVVAAVSAEIEAKGTVAPDAEAANLAEVEKQNAAALDYAKDVRPVLLAAIKKAGKETVAAMLKTFGVDKADQLKAEQLPAVLAKAQKLVA